MVFRKKRGMGPAVVFSIIAAVAALFVVTSIVGKFYDATTETFRNRDYCKASIPLSSNSRTLGGDALVPLNCDQFELTFEMSGLAMKNLVTGQTKRFPPLNTKNILTEDDIKFYVAEEIALCWDQFLAGQYNVFKNTMFPNPLKEAKRCFKCDVVKFDPEVTQKHQVVHGFLDYLKENEPFYVDTDGKSYYDFLTKKVVNKDKSSWIELVEKQGIADEGINTNKMYVIVFVKYGEEAEWSIPGIQYTLIEFEKPDYYAWLYPIDPYDRKVPLDLAEKLDINNKCEYWVS